MKTILRITIALCISTASALAQIGTLHYDLNSRSITDPPSGVLNYPDDMLRLNGREPITQVTTNNGITKALAADGLTLNLPFTLSGSGSLALSGATTISGGGTIGLGGFTFTVPATGTAVLTSRQVLAGTGLSGGGNLGADVTLSLPTVGTAGVKTFATGDTITTDAQGRVSATSNVTRTLNVSGLGLSGGGTLAADRTFTLTSSSNPGPAAAILSSDSGGGLTLLNLKSNGTSFDLVNTTATTINFGGAATAISLGNSAVLKSASYSSQTAGWGIDGTTGGADFRYLYTDEMHTKSFIADLEQALAGGQIISKSVTMVGANFTVPSAGSAATLTVRDLPSAPNMAVFQAGDFVALRTFSWSAGALTIADAVGVVTAYADGTGANEGTQTWTWTRQSGGSAGTMASGTVIAPDSLALDYGVSGNGYYEVSADDGAYDANGPYAQIVTWATSPVAANRSVRTRFGKLTGITSTAGEFGMLAGTYAATGGQFFRASNSAFELHGIDLLLWDGTANTVKINHLAPSIALGNPLPTAYGTGTGIWMGNDAGTYKWRVGNPAGNRVTWDGSTLNVVGSVTATTGNIGGWAINTDSISSGTTYLASNMNLPATTTAIAWFGKSAVGYQGFRLADGSGKYIQGITNDGGIYPYLMFSDGTRTRLVLGGLNYAWGSDGSTNSIGMKIWDSGGGKVAEFSDVKNQIAGWDISTGAITSTGVNLSSGASASLGFGSSPPTTATIGTATGLLLNANGLYSLSGGTQNVTLTSAGITAGAGNVIMDASGLSFAAPGAYTTANNLKWKLAGTTGSLPDGSIADIFTYTSSGSGVIVLEAGAGNTLTNSTATSQLRVIDSSGSGGYLSFDAYSSASAHPNSKAVVMYGNGFAGLVVNGQSSGSPGYVFPAHMLDVYGTGWFKGNLSANNASGSMQTYPFSVSVGSDRNLKVSAGFITSAATRITSVNDADSAVIPMELRGAPVIIAGGGLNVGDTPDPGAGNLVASGYASFKGSAVTINRDAGTGAIGNSSTYALQMNAVSTGVDFQLYNGAGTQITNNWMHVGPAAGVNFGGTADPAKGNIYLTGSPESLIYFYTTDSAYNAEAVRFLGGANGSAWNQGVLIIQGHPANTSAWGNIASFSGLGVGIGAGTGANVGGVGSIMLANDSAKGNGSAIVWFGNDASRYLQYSTASSVYYFNGANLSVNGTVYTSSRTSKQDIADWKPNTGARLKTHTYAMKDDPKTKRVGFIADEVKALIPEAVMSIPDDPVTKEKREGIDPMVIIAKHENDLQNARDEIDELRREVQALNAAQPKKAAFPWSSSFTDYVTRP